MNNTKLTQQYLKEILEYRDGELYWNASRKGGTATAGSLAGCQKSGGYWHTRIGKQRYSNHRLVFLMHHGYLPKFVDHIDGNRSNNRIENLRSASRQQNNCNAQIRSDNTSGIKGVSWHKKTGKWTVRVQTNKTRKWLGLFDDLELAQLVAIEARDKYHKEFARNE